MSFTLAHDAGIFPLGQAGLQPDIDIPKCLPALTN
jgi:hypothetical protein